MTAVTTRAAAAAAMTTAIETGALDKALRALKLSGMLQTIEARLAQARAGELGHIEFLQVLCEDEISRRQTMSIGRRLRKARFDEQATLEGFDFTASPKLPAAQIRDLAALRCLNAAESVILYGPVGVGKATSPRPWATSPSAMAPTPGSSRPAAPWPTWPAGTPTTPGTSGSASSPGPPS
jgi:hypothetical protein